MINYHISANEIRQMGYPLPEHIPDCATIPRNSICIEVYSRANEQDVAAGKLRMGFSLSFSKPFTWLDATIDI